MMMTHVQSEALTAIRACIVQGTAFCIHPGPPGSESRVGISSAVLIEGAPHHAVALTAAHCVEGVVLDTLQVGVPNVEAEGAVVTHAIVHEEFDIAILMFSDTFARKVAPHALPLHVLDPCEPDSASLLVLSGCPYGLLDHRSEGIGISGFSMEVTLEEMRQRADGRISIAWDDAQFLGAVVANPSAPAAFGGRVSKGDMCSPPDPSGMSGGGLWAVEPRRDADTLWAPMKQLKLLGIQSSLVTSSPPHCISEPVARWRDWALERLKQIQGVEQH